MSRITKLLLSSIAMAGLAAPINVYAAEARAVSCSVAVDYLLNDTLRAQYRKDFVVNPGEVFTDIFDTALRLGDFRATTELVAGNTVVSINFFNDVSALEFIELKTNLTVRDSRDVETTSGEHTYWQSQLGEHTTRYTLACTRFRG